MGWIVRDACQRLYGEIGRYHWYEWDRAASALGLSVAIVESSDIPSACLVDDVIIVRAGVDEETTARSVYHEIGHHVLHAGSSRDWREWPGGVHLINKFEQQANEFAEMYPVWEEP